MKTSRWAPTLAALMLVTGILSACGAGASSGDDSARELKVGILWPISGASAANSADFIAGVKTAIATYEPKLKDDKISVKLVEEDDEATPNVSVAGFQKLSTKDNVDAILGPQNSNNALAVLPLAERAGIPMVVSGTAPSLAEKGWKTFFRGTYPNKYQAAAIVNYAVGQLHWDRILVINQETEWGDDLQKQTTELAKQQGATVLPGISYAPGTTNFLSIATKAKQMNPGGIIVAGLGAEAPGVMKQLLDAGIPATHLAAFAGTDDNVVNSVIPTERREGLTLVAIFNPRAENLQTPVAQQFEKDFTARTQRDPSLYAATGYVQAEMLFNAAMKIDGDIDHANMLKELSKHEPFDSLFGNIKLNDTAELILPVLVETYDKSGVSQPVYQYVAK